MSHAHSYSESSYTSGNHRHRNCSWYFGGKRWSPPLIALTILGFIVFWPIGLAIMAYHLWGDDMKRMWRNNTQYTKAFGGSGYRPSGNSAFDEYREETLKRLEEEQEAFSEFVERLRRAKDREEFEAFMNERRGANPSAPQAAEPS